MAFLPPEITVNHHTDTLTWRRAKCEAGHCVEVAVAPESQVAVRDSKSPETGMLMFTATQWTEFLGGVGRGEFDPA
ncbi:DUF397 domain-containing protein [Nocardia sp. 2]|uniref:DUF397 domain-containing protein n=1 Tax=Nocardia acididurans TaxID=2802282 RepID=A0ABS1MKB1_9NOCA|nr:DUF397 domain-containing protein [Nocardia acididurans]MBL1080094.1 DUF397 domain-containing protein [Nocardia acididurans]